MRKSLASSALLVLLFGASSALINAQAALPPQPVLIAVGELTQTEAGVQADLSGLTNTLENGNPANILGGLGSGRPGLRAILLWRCQIVAPTPSISQI